MGQTDDEEAWIRQSRDGDSEAFSVLVARYQRMIHSVTFRMTGSQADAEDVAQEAFIRAYHQLGSFRGDAKFSTWLCRIAVNLCLNWRVRESRRADFHERWAREGPARNEGTGPDEALDDLSVCVQAALSRLPVKQRAAVVLTVCEGLSHAEAAAALGCAEATVSWRVFAARTKLRRWLCAGAKEIEK